MDLVHKYPKLAHDEHTQKIPRNTSVQKIFTEDDVFLDGFWRTAFVQKRRRLLRPTRSGQFRT